MDWPFVINLGNSIVSVSFLAMPYCMKQVRSLLHGHRLTEMLSVCDTRAADGSRIACLTVGTSAVRRSVGIIASGFECDVESNGV